MKVAPDRKSRARESIVELPSRDTGQGLRSWFMCYPCPRTGARCVRSGEMDRGKRPDGAAPHPIRKGLKPSDEGTSPLEWQEQSGADPDNTPLCGLSQNP